MTEQKRFQDSRETFYHFLDEILIVCPNCRSCAGISCRALDERPLYFRDRRLVCGHCGLVRDWTGSSFHFDWNTDPVCDSYFGQPLWLQAPCCGHVLWAFNLRHLTYLESYVRADLKSQEKHPEWGWSNQSMANRLPKWMIVAKHREAVLKTLAKLKARLV